MASFNVSILFETPPKILKKKPQQKSQGILNDLPKKWRLIYKHLKHIFL